MHEGAHCADEYRVADSVLDAEHMELDHDLLRCRASLRRIRMPEEQGLLRGRGDACVAHLLQKRHDVLGGRIERVEVHVLRVRKLRALAALLCCERRERREAVVRADGVRALENI